MRLDAVENDTDRLAQQFMETLWSADSFAAAAELESTLSTVICVTEKMMQAGKPVSLESFDQAMRRRRAILKRIADALVWRIFGSHQKFLRVYARGKSPGFMAGKTGYAGERLVVAKAQEFVPEPYRSRAKCLFAVQNDITNCLRFGDVTCLMDDQTIIPFEVKTGKKSRGARHRRQSERHDAVTEYLATDFTANPLVSELPLKHIVSHEVESRHAWIVVETVAESVAAGSPCSWAVVDDCMLVVAVDRVHQDALGTFISEALSTLDWNFADLRVGSLDRHIALHDDEVLASLAPIINWPIAHEMITDIVLESLRVLVLINVSILREAVGQAGIRVDPAQDSAPLTLTLSGTGPYEKIEIAAGMWDRLLYELLTVPSFVDQLKLLSERAVGPESPGL